MDWIHIHVIIILLGSIAYIIHSDMGHIILTTNFIGLLYGMMFDIVFICILYLIYYICDFIQ